MKTISEFAASAGVPEYTAQRWCREGKVKAVRSGRRWFVLTDGDDGTEDLTASQAAEQLGIQVSTLHRQVKAGRFDGADRQPYRMGGDWFFPAGAIEFYREHSLGRRGRASAHYKTAPKI